MKLFRPPPILKGNVGFLLIYTDADNTTTFDPSWTFSDASVMTVDWGDGSAPQSHATGLSHTYADGSRKLVRFSCPNWLKLTSFNVNADVCRLSPPSFAMAKALGWLYLHTIQCCEYYIYTTTNSAERCLVLRRAHC